MTNANQGHRRSPGRSRPIGFTTGAIVGVVVAVTVALLLRNAFVATHHIVGWVVACSVVAVLIDVVVTWLQRWIPRWAAIIAVLVVVLAVLAGLVAAIMNELTNSFDELQQAAPEAARGLEDRFSWARNLEVAKRVEDLVDGLHDDVTQFELSRALGTVPTYFVTTILMLFLLGWGRRYVSGFIDQFRDPACRLQLHHVISRSVRRGRRYLIITLAVSFVTGLVFGLVCWLLGLPAPFTLGVIVGVFTPLPLVGIVIGGVPALLLAFGAETWPVGLVVVAAIAVLQCVEALVVRPVVDSRTVRLGPTVPIIVGLLAFELYGVGGAVYAIALSVFGVAALDAIGWARGDDEPTADHLEETSELIRNGPGLGIDDAHA